MRGHWPDRAAQIENTRAIGWRNLGRMNPALAPTERPTTHDIAWAAGIYEGEGACAINHGSASIIVTQKDDWILRRLRALFGGSVKPRVSTSSRLGPHAAHAWVLCGPRGRGFLMTVFAFLSPRRKTQVLDKLKKPERPR